MLEDEPRAFHMLGRCCANIGGYWGSKGTCQDLQALVFCNGELGRVIWVVASKATVGCIAEEHTSKEEVGWSKGESLEARKVTMPRELGLSRVICTMCSFF